MDGAKLRWNTDIEWVRKTQEALTAKKKKNLEVFLVDDKLDLDL